MLLSNSLLLVASNATQWIMPPFCRWRWSRHFVRSHSKGCVELDITFRNTSDSTYSRCVAILRATPIGPLPSCFDHVAFCAPPKPPPSPLPSLTHYYMDAAHWAGRYCLVKVGQHHFQYQGGIQEIMPHSGLWHSGGIMQT